MPPWHTKTFSLRAFDALFISFFSAFFCIAISHVIFYVLLLLLLFLVHPTAAAAVAAAHVYG